MPRRAIKRAETAPGYADIGVIDIPVDNVGDKRFRVKSFSLLIGQPGKMKKVVVFKQKKSIVAVNPAIIF